MSINKHSYLITGIAIAIYFAVFLNLKIGLNAEVLYSSPDAKSYLMVANWLQNGVDTSATEIRPMLYPILLWITSGISEIYGIWVLQFLLWIGAVNLTFRSTFNITANLKYAYIASLILATNLSLIALTLHALTEVCTVFLLSALVFFLVTNIAKYREASYLNGCMLILGLLTVLKPVFLIPLLIGLFVVLPLFYLRAYLNTPIKMLSLAILLLPFWGQLTLMKIKHDTVTVSNIGGETVKNYLFSRGIRELEGLEVEESLERANALTDDELRTYVYDHAWHYFTLFLSNIESNIKAPATFLLSPPGPGHEHFANFMRNVNNLYFLLHILFIPLFLYLAFNLYNMRAFQDLTILVTLYFLASYYVVVSGVSFWQGDRLVLPAIAVWPILYSFITYHLIRLRKENQTIKTKHEES